MDERAMFQLSYGLFVLTAQEDGFDNGCIINTAMQVTTTPLRMSITVNKSNKTEEMIEKTGAFNVSILGENTPFEIFKHFGFQSGRDVNKFADFTEVARSENGLYYLTGAANAYLSGKVVEQYDLGTHMLFIADVTAGEILSDVPSVTYTYYQDHIKPKPQSAPAGKTKWVCKICGYEYDPEKGDPDNGIPAGTAFEDLPEDWVCPICKHGKMDFEKVTG